MSEDDVKPNNVKLREWTDAMLLRNAYWEAKLSVTPETVEGYMTGEATPDTHAAKIIEVVTQGDVPADQWGSA